MMTSPPLLLSVSRAVPEAIQAIPHLCQSISSFLLPPTIDSAVYNDLQRVLRTFGAFVPWTTRAMDGAAARGRLAIVQRLVATRSEGCSAQAFIGAAANGHLEVLQWLRQQQPYADLYNASDCLTAAAEGGQVDAVRTIRREQERGGYFFLEEFLGPAMKAAANRGDVDMLEALKPWPFDRTGAFSAAAVQGHVPVLEILYSHSRENRAFIFCSNATLREVAERGNCDVVEFLLQMRDENRVELMLSAAARAGQTSVVQSILRSCEIHEAGISHALREGVDNSSYSAVELLLDQCRTEYEGCSNISVLIRSAVERGDVKMVGILAKRCRSDAMESALENTAKSGNRDMVKLLLDTCATRNLNDSTLRCTVAEAAKNAISCGDVEVAKLLLGEYDGSGAGQVKSARKGKLGVLSTLLELSDHETVLDALFKIASPENVEISKLMLEKCVDSVFAHIFGHAAEHGFVALVQRLLDRVDPCTVNRTLVRAPVRGHAEVVQALLGRCDETNIDFALEVAAWVGHADVVVMLRDRCDPGSVKNALANATAMEVVHLLSNKKARTA